MAVRMGDSPFELSQSRSHSSSRCLLHNSCSKCVTQIPTWMHNLHTWCVIAEYIVLTHRTINPPTKVHVRAGAIILWGSSLHPFGVVYWVAILSNIKTCDWVQNKWAVAAFVFAIQWLWITNISSAFKDGLYTWKTNLMHGWHLVNAWRSHPFGIQPSS